MTVSTPRTRVRIWTANLAYPTGWRKDDDHLRHLIATVPAGVACVLLLQEAKNLLGKHTLDRILSKLLAGTWHGLTGTNPATAGSAVYGHGIRIRGLHQWLLGKFPQTLARWTTQGRIALPGGRCVVMSAHVPPARSGKAAQLDALEGIVRRVRRAVRRGDAWVVGTDANMPLKDVARYLHARGIESAVHGEDRGHGIVGLVCSPRLIVVRHGEDTYGKRQGDTDHPAEFIDVAGIRPGHKR